MKNNDEILELIKKRLDVGAKKYGEQVPIDASRDNLKESIEELLDLSVYAAATSLELHKKYQTPDEIQKIISNYLAKLLIMDYRFKVEYLGGGGMVTEIRKVVDEKEKK